MSTIGSSLPSTVLVPSSDPAPVSAATSQAATPTQSYKPQWLVPSASGSSNFDMLGLPMPKASGDLAALIAQVSLSLESTVDEGRKMSAVAKLAGLASALSPLDNTALKSDLDKKQGSEDRAKATKAALNTQATALGNERAAASGQVAQGAVDLRIQDERVASANREIADLRLDLAAAKPGSTEATNLQQQITSKESYRDAIQTSVSNARSDITAYTNQVANYQKQIDAEKAKTDPDKPNPEEITRLETAKSASQTNLNQTYSNLKTAASNGLSADQATLAGTLTTKTAERAAAWTKLANSNVVGLALAQVAASAYQASQAQDNAGKASRDTGIDLEFQDIASELKDVSARKELTEAARDAEGDAFVDSARERAETVALALVRSVADIVAALLDVANLAVPKETGAGERNRVRIDA